MRVRVDVQVSRMEFYTDTVALILDCSKISILYKKKICYCNLPYP